MQEETWDNKEKQRQPSSDTQDIHGFSRAGSSRPRPRTKPGEFHFDRYRMNENTGLGLPKLKKRPVQPRKSKVKLTNLSSKRKNKRKLMLIGGIIFIVLIIAGIIISVIISRSRNNHAFPDHDVIFGIDAVQEIKSGSEITYTINGKNNTETKLTNMELNVTFPEKFTFISSNPQAANSLNNRWALSDLEPGGSFAIEIKGRIIGQEETVASFSSRLDYRPANFSSDFSEEASIHTTILSPSVTLELDYPKQATPNSEVEYEITYTNVSDEVISDLGIRVEIPSTFELSDVMPKATKSNDFWELEPLQPDNSETITLVGILNGNEGETKRIVAQLGSLDDNMELNVQTEEIGATKLVASAIELDMSVNKKTNIIAKPGEELSFEITYKNAGSTGMKGVVIENVIDSQYLNLASFESLGGSIKGDTITWNASGVPELGILEAGEQGTLTFSVPIKDSIVLKKESEKGVKISSVTTLSSGSLPEKIESNEVEVKVVTTVVFSSEIRYYEVEGDTPVGSGPLPPKVSATTTYRVYLNVTNTTNDVEKAVVTTTLSPEATWAGGSKVSAGEDLVYNSSTKKVTWGIGNIPAGVGQILSGLEASFLISITPNTSQVGKVINLTDGGLLTATDSFTQTTVSSSDIAKTTALEFDERAKGKERVVE